LEHVVIHPKSITAETFIPFIEQLSVKFEGKRFAIFLDNLSVHKTQDVRATYQRLDILPIFNVPYSPDYNGIEKYFAQVKAQYKKQLLQRLMKGERLDPMTMIKQSVENVKDESVRKCVGHGMKCIEE
jgi:transposase